MEFKTKRIYQKDLMHPLSQEIEQMKKELYGAFFEQNKGLLQTNPSEYFLQSRRYVEDKIHEYFIEEYVRKGK